MLSKEKSAGVLLHISSLPGEYGIGTLGKSAYEFVDFLHNAKQKYWQILPINPTSYGDSPYQSTSSMAFNHYFIDLKMLVEEGLLDNNVLDIDYGTDEGSISYELLFKHKMNSLKQAYLNKDKVIDDFILFKNRNQYWLDSYSLFYILKEHFNYNSWNTWPDSYKYKNKETIDLFLKENEEKIDTIKFVMFLFYRQWMKLKKYANKLGVQIIGDMPIYCAYDSSDVYSNFDMFLLDEKLDPTFVAGCPPDMFSPDGQLWGNPLYDYEYLEKNDYKFWVDRVRQALELFDVVRIDHFRGFSGYYKIPYGDKTARNGSWSKGPGRKLFDEIKKQIKNTNIIAENLGFLDDDVHQLLRDTEFPGMHIMQFEFGDFNLNIPILRDFEENNIIYTATHDNMTTNSWYNSLSDEEKNIVNKICGIEIEKEAYIKIIDYVMSKKPNICIIPLQDYLNLDDNSRMNTPGVFGGNWCYRTTKDSLDDKLCKLVKNLTIKNNRNV